MEGNETRGRQQPRRPPELDMLNETAREKLAERTRGMSEVERDAEERAFAAEIRAGMQTHERLERHREEVRRSREDRLKAGRGSMADSIQKFFGW